MRREKLNVNPMEIHLTIKACVREQSKSSLKLSIENNPLHITIRNAVMDKLP